MTDDVLVIGSGVTGLTTAILLAEAGRTVLIRTSRPAADTTSVVAGALLGPIIPEDDERVAGWLTHGDRVFRELAADPSTGVRIARGRLVGIGPDVPRWAPDVPGFELCNGHDRLKGFGTTFRVSIPLADMRCYLGYLVTRFERAGGRIELGTMHSLEQAAGEAPIVVNCTGVEAADLTGDDDLHPVRGQHVIVANPGLTDFVYEGSAAGPRWASFFPHGDRVVLGGIAQPGNRDLTPDADVTAELIRRTAAVEPRLAGAEVLGVEVGLRPKRSRLRIEAETIGGSTVVHHYGHGGNGVQWSWGSARDAVALVDRA